MDNASKSAYESVPPLVVDRGGLRYRTTFIEQSIGPIRPVAGSSITPPLYITSSRPPYIPEGGALGEGMQRYYITWGTLNDQLASNWDDHYDISSTTYFFAKATLRTTNTLRITTWEILTGSTPTAHVTADWAVGEVRPTSAVCMLGVVYVTSGEHSVANSGGGSLVLSEHLQNVEADGSGGAVKLSRQLVHTRLNY